MLDSYLFEEIDNSYTSLKSLCNLNKSLVYLEDAYKTSGNYKLPEIIEMLKAIKSEQENLLVNSIFAKYRGDLLRKIRNHYENEE